MIKYLVSELSATAVPSMRLLPAMAAWQLAEGPWAARKRTAPSGAPAYAHVVCAAQHTFQVSGEKSVSQAVVANFAEVLGSATAQLIADATRVDGRAGSPPRGTPPV